ncbi:hypothetical protein Poli38472_002661 [Pythium oligandrum]|uniref:Protein kinase domain-containing protein n=1 Tax=Pythium oligandrum TaxID=41045 RepID=A0A8K1FHB2_PYTOL|nr:hypothetical protein Poli38472_002661 [Pythium oligandrum]|eukprot:TMW63720.1 hypothetical protein Poli38472_002661 [Pythium oligandrum]
MPAMGSFLLCDSPSRSQEYPSYAHGRALLYSKGHVVSSTDDSDRATLGLSETLLVMMMRLSVLAVVFGVAVKPIVLVDAASFACPLDVPAATLSMACSLACPDTFMPCLYHTKAVDCVDDKEKTNLCVAGSGGCAVECLLPLSGVKNDSWNLMITDESEYKLDVSARKSADPSFRLLKRSTDEITTIRDLVFPPTAKNIVITGNALPILDKAVDYPVIYHGYTLNVNLTDFTFLQNATSATTLIMENLNLSTLAAIPTLPQLETLQLGNSLLNAVPTNLTTLKSLKRLDLGLNTILRIADNSLPTSLVDLCLQDCALDRLPTDIMRMPALKKLDLSGNRFPLPAEGTLPLQIEHFVFWGLYHKRLPPDLPKMTQLKKIEIGWNDFSNASTLSLLPQSIEELHLIDVLLTELPSSLSKLPKLTWMEAGLNNLKNISRGTLPPTLRFLNLSVNYLSSIEEFALPSSLGTLDLAVNTLTAASLPQSLVNLSQLTHLYLHENQFERVPPILFLLPHLQVLTLHRNPNMSMATDKVTFNTMQLAFLSTLKTFTIDQTALETRCKTPVPIAHTNYTVCHSDDTSIKRDSNSTAKATPVKGMGTMLIVGIGVALGGLLAILIGAVHWKKRRAAQQNAIDPRYTDGKDSLDGLLISKDDERDLDAVLDKSHATAYMAMHTTITKTTIHKTSQSSDPKPTKMASIWDDEELLQKRLDMQMIQDVELLASGIDAEVWLANYMGSQVAVKRLKKYTSSRGGDTDYDSSSGLSTQQRSAIQRFVHEIKLHMRLEHPRIVSFMGVAWTMEDDLQAVVEYLPQGDLRTYLTSCQGNIMIERFDEDDGTHHWDDRTFQLAIEIAEALVYLHSLTPAVLHRDLKSRNVLIDDAFHAKVSDFGVSRYALDEDDDTEDTKQWLMTTGVGTARWTAPEVLMGQHARYTTAVDVYSFGVILSELDTWDVPFSEIADLPETAILTQICNGERQPRFRRSSPEPIVRLGRQCLSLDPSKRPTAIEIAYSLRQCHSMVSSTSQQWTKTTTTTRTSRSEGKGKRVTKTTTRTVVKKEEQTRGSEVDSVSSSLMEFDL